MGTVILWYTIYVYEVDMKNMAIFILAVICIIIAGYYIYSQCANKKLATYIKYTDVSGQKQTEKHVQVK